MCSPDPAWKRHCRTTLATRRGHHVAIPSEQLVNVRETVNRASATPGRSPEMCRNPMSSLSWALPFRSKVRLHRDRHSEYAFAFSLYIIVTLSHCSKLNAVTGLWDIALLHLVLLLGACMIDHQFAIDWAFNAFVATAHGATVMV